MNKILRVAVVEDEESSALTLFRFLDRYTQETSVVFQTTRFQSGNDFLNGYQPCYDIVFMDIMLPGINGMETAARLRKLDSIVTLIFVTNLAKFAVKGYEVSALDFIVKPVVYASFKMKMDKAVSVASRYSDEKVVVRSGGNTKIFSTSEIFYIEVYNHDLIYCTSGGKFTAHGSLNDVEKQLKKNNFSRCSSGFLVNLRYVGEINGNICYIDGQEIPIGRSKKKSFMMDLANYLGRSI